MPRSLTTSTITSLTGPSQVTITEDGRIELLPTQTVALVDGQPVDANVSVSGNQVSVRTNSTRLALDFGGQTTDSTASGASSASTVVHGTTISFTGDGFGAESPVVTWIQSNPIKLSEAMSSASGSVTDEVRIPRSIEPGEHTIQVNGIDSSGRVVSIIYGVQVEAANAQQPTSQSTQTWQLWLWPLSGLIVLVLLIVLIVLLRRRMLARR